MAQPFDLLECKKYRVIEESVSNHPDRGFTIPATGRFDTRAYVEAIDRVVSELEATVQRKIETYMNWPHCRQDGCKYKLFMYALEDSPVVIDYQGVVVLHDVASHSFRVDFTRTYKIYIECQPELTRLPENVELTEVDWELIDKFIQESTRLHDVEPG